MQSHLTQVLGDFCKAEFPFSLCSLPHISHLLSAISWSGWLISPVSPPSSTDSAPFCLHSPRSRAAMPQAPSGAHSLVSAVCTGGPGPRTPFRDPVPSHGQPCNAHLPGPLPTHLAGGPHVLPGNGPSFRIVLLTWLTHTGLDLLLLSSSKVTLRSFDKKARSVCPSDNACSECPASCPQRQGVLVYQSCQAAPHPT